MNTFAQSLDAFVSAQRKGEGAFGMLVQYVHALPVGTDAKADLKNAEESYKASHPKLDAMPVAYRSAKSVILSAVAAGIALVGEDGKPKGKTELEKAIKAEKEEKSELAKFQAVMNSATQIFAKLTDPSDILSANALVTELAKQVVAAKAALPK